MRLRNRMAAAGLASLCALTPWVGAQAADISPELKALIDVSNREGALSLVFGEGSLGGERGARRFETAMRETWGANLKVTFTPGPALPAMASTLGEVERVSWVVVAYLLANTIAAPVCGRLGDALGRKRMIFVALAVFMLCSAPLPAPSSPSPPRGCCKASAAPV